MFKKTLFFLLTAALLTFSSCYVDDSTSGNTDTPSIVGKWTSGFDAYEFSSDNTVTYYYEVNPDTVAFTGVIAKTGTVTDTEGTTVTKLTIQLTSGGIYDDTGTWTIDYTYMVDSYFTTFAYKNLSKSGDTITGQISTAYKGDGTESLIYMHNAVTTHTLADYFGFFGDYTKQ